ncbi:MAG TPA: alkaline phosphatase family protein [Thermoleophilaceae bacterium]|nr:alkaline phosphatase family protein [Thermoleophilaceae bacterium]
MSCRKVVALLFALSMLVVAAPASAHRGHSDRPKHVVIIVLDQARADTIDRYDMKNVQALQRKGTSFPNGMVGHMAAETVISHNVITSGQLPKDMGWSNEVYRDTDGVLGAPNRYYVTSSMSCNQFKALIAHGNYNKLQDYLDSKFGESSRFASISQKRTSACTSGQTRSTDPEDIIFQIRNSSAPNCDGRSGWRSPEYANGPAGYFDLSPCSRWYTWQAAGAYGTGSTLPAKIYPLDGNRFVPGFDPAHFGGDTWSADAAIQVIDTDPTWHGMMVSLGGIDKMGHMWGPEDNVTGPPGSDQQVSHLPYIAKNADAQVGRIVDALDRRGLLDDTLIVITADHAAQTGNPFHGRFDGFPPPEGNGCDPATTSNGIRSDCNWYYGAEDGLAGETERYLDPSPAVGALRDRLGGNLAFSYQDTQVAAWLHNTSVAMKREAAAAVLDMPDVMASFYINPAQNDYRLYGSNHITGAERSYFARHAEELVDTMANSSAPDVVGLVRTNSTYGVMGDHGGSTRLVQNIPMVFSGPGVGSKDSNKEMRLVDVMPTILETMGISYDEDSMDGEAVRLSDSR